MKTNDENLEPGLAELGAKIAAMNREEPPAGLVSRTIDRISRECKPVKKVFFMLRPITHPLARVAAAALIVFSLFPMTDLNIADPLGRRIEERIIGRHTAEKIEGLVDNLLVRFNNDYSGVDPDMFMGAQRLGTPVHRTRSAQSPGRV